MDILVNMTLNGNIIISLSNRESKKSIELRETHHKNEAIDLAYELSEISGSSIYVYVEKTINSEMSIIDFENYKGE